MSGRERSERGGGAAGSVRESHGMSKRKRLYVWWVYLKSFAYAIKNRLGKRGDKNRFIYR